MDALWRRGPLVVEDIIADAAPAPGWSDATVKALIGRLLKKQAIVSFREGGRTRYRPLVERDAYIAAESQGPAGSPVRRRAVAVRQCHFAEHRKLHAPRMSRD